MKGAYIVRCDEVVTDGNGNVTELKCTYFPETRSGSAVKSEVKAKGVIQWVDAKYGKDAVFTTYKPLLKDEEYPDQDYAERLDKNSINTCCGKVEPYAAECAGKSFQLMRTGYYKVCPPKDGKAQLSEIVSLKDSFNK